MYISKLKLHNFRGFKGNHVLNFNSGINFLVGDNNCGETSVFRAVEFVQSGKDVEQFITKGLDDKEYVSVELEITGTDLKTFIESTETLGKYKQYMLDDGDGNTTLRIMRSSEEVEIEQGKKAKKLNIKNVRVFNPKTDQFENPTGIDTTLSALFETQFVWANINIEDIADVSKTKICGRIINRVINNSSESWNKFATAHKEAFKDIQDQLQPIEAMLKEKMSKQYGETEIKFNFSLPELAEFLKFGTINLSDNGIQTTSSEKGTGMQRALALAIIQVYAELESKVSDDLAKPLIFFLDEPETFLHPKAQARLLQALDKLSEKSQTFISTHSPYMLRSFEAQHHALYIFTKESGTNCATAGEALNLFGDLSPTWGEINYKAFDMTTPEFHDELYGFIQEQAIKEDEEYYMPKEFDKYLLAKNPNLTIDKNYKHLKSDNTLSEYNTTIATYIRNVIHHPENPHNERPTPDDFKVSVSELLKILRDASK